MTRNPFASVATPTAIARLQTFEMENNKAAVLTKGGVPIPLIQWSSVSVDSVLGKGSFGCVFQVHLRKTEDDDDDENGDEHDQDSEPSEVVTSSLCTSTLALTFLASLPPPANGTQISNSNNIDSHTASSTSTEKAPPPKKKYSSNPKVYALKCLNSKKVLDTESFLMAATDLWMEAYLLARLDHENIVQLHGVSASSLAESYQSQDSDDNDNNTGTNNNSIIMGYFLVIDLLQKDTLADRLSKWRQQLQIIRPALCATESTGRLERGSSSSPGIWLHELTKKLLFSKKESQSREPTTTTTGMHGPTTGYIPPTLDDRLKTIGMSVANAMKYMHGKGVVLRDLKPENVGFDPVTDRIKIFDFGLARSVTKLLHSENCTATTELAGSFKYMAPETILQTTKITERDLLATDVYSFGILLWELVTLQVPFDEDDYDNNYIDDSVDGMFTSREHFSKHVAQGGWRPSTKSINFCKPLKRLMEDCWDANADARPSFARVWLVLSDLCHDTNHNAFTSVRLQRKQQQQTPTKTKKHPNRQQSFLSFFGGRGGSSSCRSTRSDASNDTAGATNQNVTDKTPTTNAASQRSLCTC
jgi:serine/threonine protein kinase